jgi:hypothetical protein
MVKNPTCLVADDAHVILTTREWFEAYHLAQRFGWTPAGTILRGIPHKCDCTHRGGPPCRRCRRAADRWDGDYLRRCYQLVTEPDAAALAAALLAASYEVPYDPPPWRYAELGVREALPIEERLTEDLLDYWAAHEQGNETLGAIFNVANSGDFHIHGKL